VKVKLLEQNGLLVTRQPQWLVQNLCLLSCTNCNYLSWYLQLG